MEHTVPLGTSSGTRQNPFQFGSNLLGAFQHGLTGPVDVFRGTPYALPVKYFKTRIF